MNVFARSCSIGMDLETERIMKVLIGYDGSDSARAAIQGLHRAGLPPDAEVLVLSAADEWPPLPPSASAPLGGASSPQASSFGAKAQALAAESLAQAQTLAAEGGKLVKAQFPTWKVSQEAYPGSPSAALIQASSGMDLVVVGSHGRSALSGMLLGSVSQNVLTHAPCSVRISRQGGNAVSAPDTPVRIVLGIDGSTHSAMAASAIASRPWPPDTDVKIIAVMDMRFWTAMTNPKLFGWAWIGEGADSRSWADHAVRAVARELRSKGLVPIPLVEEGDPKKVLMEEARRWDADCIFLGARGHSRLERFLLGSISASVAARASSSVEVVRQG